MNPSGLSFVPAYKSQLLHVHNDMGDVLILTSHVGLFPMDFDGCQTDGTCCKVDDSTSTSCTLELLPL